LLQLLCLVAMEPPTDLSADSIRDEKVKVIRSLRPLSRNEVANNVVRGQYVDGAIHGDPVVGYRQEQNVKPDSQTETFVALRLFIDNWRWANVPIYMRVGKRLPKSATEISIHFKKAPAVLFNKGLSDQNVLVIRIQPDEGISLRIHAKVPGASFRIEPVKMDFHYGTSFGKASPEAPHFLRVATRSRKPGLLSIRSRRPGMQKKMRPVCFSILPVHGDRKKLMICLPAMAGRGEDYERYVCGVIPSAARDLTKSERLRLGERSFASAQDHRTL
jgi:Glucose-6-phosphate dehydrogenase, C-terminal domain